VRRFITKGPKVGRCNVCGNVGPLTEDHTPPKGAIRVKQVEMHHIARILNVARPSPGGRFSQDGVKFRTLCARCNNEFLGAKYDPAFNEFSQAVGLFLKSSLVLPPVTYVKGQPQKIARSLFGHLSAQGIDRYLKGPHTDDLRDYFLDPTRPLPDYWNIYYWVYPYQTQVLVRDAVLKDLRCEDNAYIWIMKFFPLAFLMVWDDPKGYGYSQYPNLMKWRHIAIDDTVDMPVQLTVVPHERWPEAPTEHTFLMYGEGAMGAFAKGKVLV
jgi:hypothetical protein